MKIIRANHLQIVDKNYVADPALTHEQLSILALEARCNNLEEQLVAMQSHASFGSALLKDCTESIVVWLSSQSCPVEFSFFRTKFGQGRWRNILSDYQIKLALNHLVKEGRLLRKDTVYPATPKRAEITKASWELV